MRGKRRDRHRRAPGPRLIPAYAGKTIFGVSGQGLAPAHPRVCGENHFWGFGSRACPGSSPRMRGKLVNCVLGHLPCRLIPAYAGKTPSLRPGANHLGAHPRVCGENCTMSIAIRPPAGSSPRMRGKPCLQANEGPRSRLIPAYAGKTYPSGRGPYHRGAHPRVCGENSSCAYADSVFYGSSPRMRGKLIFTPYM